MEEGEEIFPVMAGPFTVLDSHVWMAALGQQSGFNVNWDQLDGHVSDHGWVDPETNAPRWRAEAHLVDAAGHATGMRKGAYGHHGQFESLMQKAVQNWMGDTTTVTGKVIRKSIEEGRHMVDLDVQCETQTGEVHQTCKVKAILPARGKFIYDLPKYQD